MSLATAFANLKSHVEAMFTDLKNGVQLQEQHLHDLVSHVETVGEHIAQGGRTLITVDFGNIAVADAEAALEKIMAEFSSAKISSIVQEAETAVQSAVSSEPAAVPAAPATTAAQ
jgi:hypothetical protein